MRHRTESGFK